MLKSFADESIYQFLKSNCPSSNPLLLALSGGPDSLYLFTCLLNYREKTKQIFHVAHVDHGWRSSSQEEALILKKLAKKHLVPFHLHQILPSELAGNLEAACREERYKFFMQLNQIHHFQAVLTGHHQDDQAETILKRLLEGAHWSCWQGVAQKKIFKDLLVLRPLLSLTKNQILEELTKQKNQPFIDPTNEDVKFLRARMRQMILPQLSTQFGKNITPSLISIGKEAEKLTNYFEKKLAPLLENKKTGPWGLFIDLQKKLPSEELEINYLIRILCKEKEFFLSKVQIQQISQGLYQKKANCQFQAKKGTLWIDRERIFYLIQKSDFPSFLLKEGKIRQNQWVFSVEKTTYDPSQIKKALEQGWQGQLVDFLPLSSDYTIGFIKNCPHAYALKKKWAKSQVPSFLYSYFPIIWNEKEVKAEFLTHKSLYKEIKGEVKSQECLKVTGYFQH